jgi:hypothetical protein
MPHGELCGTTLFYRELAVGEADAEPRVTPDRDCR